VEHVRRSAAVRAVRRGARFSIVALVCALFAAGAMTPFLGESIYQNGDLWNFLGGVVEARNALAEGQFPARVAPNQLDGQRYPVFQFYANLPYSVAASILGDAGRNPYAAWKWTMFAALIIGGLSLHRLAWRWTRSQPAALSAVAVFLSAPYLLTDLYDRGAVAEAIAICLLPAALLATWTTLVRPGLWRIALCAATWTALGLTHNITYLYGATFIGVFIVTFLRPQRRSIRRVGRLALAAVLHLMMLAWYVVPQVALMPELAISTGLSTPAWSASLVPLKVLLWPVLRTPETSTIPRLGLQAGWLVLASGVAGLLAAVWGGRRGRGSDRSWGLRRGVAVRMAALWAVAFLAAWSPVDFWSVVPRFFHFVQFTYRLLGFTLFFAAVLAALGVATMGSGRRAWIAFAVVAIAAAATQVVYQPDGLYHPRGAHRWINDRPQLGGLGDYLLRPRDSAPVTPDMDLVPAEVFAVSHRAGDVPVFRAEVRRPTRLELPVLWYPGMLEVRVNGRQTEYGVSGRRTTVDLPPGRHVVRVRFVGVKWANHLSAAGTMLVLAVLGWKIGVPLRGRRRV